MLDIGTIKTRDQKVLDASLAEIVRDTVESTYTGQVPTQDFDVLLDLVERMQCDTTIFFNREIKKWVFTDVYEDYIMSQDFFNRENFVIVERDLPIALARGIHYRYHKKLRD